MTVTCSAQRLVAGEPLAGSAPFARLWVMLEQPGPWGRDALHESHLDGSVAEALTAAVAEHPARVGLIRSVGAHADLSAGPRTLLVARTDSEASWLTVRHVDDVASLASDWLDVDALLRAEAAPTDLPGVPLPTPHRALLVCTNAKRDQCCAVLGRPLAAALASRPWSEPTPVWETSHTGGHRFAPTFVSLPDGYLYGGPTAEHGDVDACRGRSSLEPEAQVAELAVLRELGAGKPRPLQVDRVGDRQFRVRAGAASFDVGVTQTSGVDRSESCGKPAVASRWPTASIIGSPRTIGDQ